MSQSEPRPFPFIVTDGNDQFTALGQLVTQCAYLEFLVFRRLCRGLPKDHHAALERRPIFEKLDELEKISGQLSGKAADGYLAAINQMRAVFPLRNNLVHGTWMIRKEEGGSVAINPRRPTEAVPIDTVADALGRAAIAANELLDSMLAEAGIEDFPRPVPFFYGPQL